MHPREDLFESIEPNSTAELTGLGIGRPQATETVNLSHFPYREDLAYGWPDDAVRFRDQALPFDGHRLLIWFTTHQPVLRRAHATKPQRWTGRMESATGKRNTDCRLAG